MLSVPTKAKTTTDVLKMSSTMTPFPRQADEPENQSLPTSTMGPDRWQPEGTLVLGGMWRAS